MTHGDDGAARRAGRADGADGAAEQWLAELRIDEERRRRRAVGDHRELQRDEATFVGTLIDMAERRDDIVVTTTTRQHRGRLIGVGLDVIALDPNRAGERGGRGERLIIALGHITAVRAWAAARPTTGDREPAVDVTFDEVVHGLAAERAPVTVGLASGDMVVGELRSVGIDVAVIRTESTPPSETVVPLGSVTSVTY